MTIVLYGEAEGNKEMFRNVENNKVMLQNRIYEVDKEEETGNLTEDLFREGGRLIADLLSITLKEH